MNKIYTLLLLLNLSLFSVFAQCPASSAVSDVTLQCTGGTTNRTGVAFNPNQNLYYSVNAGNGSYPIETFAVTGGNALSSTAQNADYRGLWWNSLTNTIEGNTFSNGGIYRHDLAGGTFYAAGTTSLVAPSTMPNVQSMGHADIPNNIIVHYNGGTIYKYSRSTGILINSYAITGLPVPTSNLNTYGIGYCGVQGGEVVVYDYINRAVYFINYNTGAYLQTCTLPSTAPNSSNFMMGYANNRLFLYNSGTNQWIGYPIVSNSAVSAVSSPSAICNGASAVLSNTAASTVSYTWNTGVQNTSITVSPTVTTTYTLTGTNSTGCTASVGITIVVNSAAPVITVVPSSTSACLGQTLMLTGSGALTYTWNNGVTNGVAFSPTSTANYILSGQNACGTSSASINIPVQPLQVQASAASTVVCASNAVALSATSSATSYTWLPVNAFGSTVSVAPTANTTYTVIGQVGPCVGSALVSLSVMPLPSLSISAPSNSVCEGQQFTLTASGASSYTWMQGGSNSSSAVFSQTASSIYAVSGTNSLGCTNSTSYGVVNMPPPTLSLSPTQTLVCAGSTVGVSALGNGTQFQWNTGASTSSIVLVPNTSPFVCVVVVYSSNNCTATKSVAISLLTPTVAITGNSVICLGNSATLSATGSGTVTWQGIGQGSNMVLTPTSTTIYTLTASTKSNNLTCARQYTTQVNVNALPSVSVVSTRTNICKNEKTVLTATGAATYLWNNNSTQGTFTYTGSTIGNFFPSVTGTDANGCSATASITIKVLSCTGLEQLNTLPGIEIYPVPSRGDLIITGEAQFTLILSDVSGKLIGIYQLGEENNNKLQIHGLSPGIYLLQDVNGTFSKRIVIID